MLAGFTNKLQQHATNHSAYEPQTNQKPGCIWRKPIDCTSNSTPPDARGVFVFVFVCVRGREKNGPHMAGAVSVEIKSGGRIFELVETSSNLADDAKRVTPKSSVHISARSSGKTKPDDYAPPLLYLLLSKAVEQSIRAEARCVKRKRAEKQQNFLKR